MKRFITGFLIVMLAACESNPPAPVIDRMPQSSKPKPAIKPLGTKPVATNKDWRPDSHVVKKGDTLFGIGLEYGVDYKEIAAANNIAAPYPIQIGQKIDLSSFKTKTTTTAESSKMEGDVVLTPMKTEPAVIGAKQTDVKPTETKPATSAVTPILSEPKAVREVYSLEALNRTAPKPTVIASAEPKPANTKPTEIKPTDAKSTDAKPAEAKPTDTKPIDDESITWAWPTQGKLLAGFNEASNKGLDIAGKTGQTISAASSGKVIYSGSDLRGYGKLVIIKHNKTYLSVYAHNSKIVVKEGQNITAGQKIAEMGDTDSNSVKLHFEIRRLGKSVDPAKYLTQN